MGDSPWVPPAHLWEDQPGALGAIMRLCAGSALAGGWFAERIASFSLPPRVVRPLGTEHLRAGGPRLEPVLGCWAGAPSAWKVSRAAAVQHLVPKGPRWRTPSFQSKQRPWPLPYRTALSGQAPFPGHSSSCHLGGTLTLTSEHSVSSFWDLERQSFALTGLCVVVGGSVLRSELSRPLPNAGEKTGCRCGALASEFGAPVP